jgi:hypothetical protein
VVCLQLVIIVKTSHTHFNNGKIDLSSKDFLKHDLLHYVIDKELSLYNDADPTTHSLEIEQLAGVLHTVYDSTISNQRILEGGENLWSAYGKQVPEYFTNEFIASVRENANKLLARYEQMKTGESMELA